VCGVKIYENKPFKTQVMQNKTYKVYKIMNAPTKVLPTARSLSALFWCSVDEIFLHGYGPLFY